MNTTIQATTTWEQLCKMTHPKKGRGKSNFYCRALYVPNVFPQDGWFGSPRNHATTFQGQSYLGYEESNLWIARWRDDDALLEATRGPHQQWWIRYVGAADGESFDLLQKFFAVAACNQELFMSSFGRSARETARSLEGLLGVLKRDLSATESVNGITKVLSSISYHVEREIAECGAELTDPRDSSLHHRDVLHLTAEQGGGD